MRSVAESALLAAILSSWLLKHLLISVSLLLLCDYIKVAACAVNYVLFERQVGIHVSPSCLSLLSSCKVLGRCQLSSVNTFIANLYIVFNQYFNLTVFYQTSELKLGATYFSVDLAIRVFNFVKLLLKSKKQQCNG